MSEYTRTPQQLRMKASLYWPSELTAKEAKASIIPKLIETHEKFISLLDISDSSPVAWKGTLKQTSALSANLFLKHLMVLADFGGEPLKRLRPEFKNIFPDDIMRFGWEGKAHKYRFKSITNTGRLDNVSLFVDGKGLLKAHPLTDTMEDVIMLLLHGGAATGGNISDPITEKCTIGVLTGHKQELKKFVKQRYIWVSRITCGAAANAMGQLAQDYVKELLQDALPNWTITRSGRIPGISHNDGKTDIGFDVLAISPATHYVAIEVCFQFTTNSVIERKAGQAQARAQMVKAAGCHIAYVIDGAGNFERNAALRTICDYSDCTVALTPSEINVLVKFLEEVG